MVVHWVNIGPKRHTYVGQTSAQRWLNIITVLITMAVHWVNVGPMRHTYVGQTSAQRWLNIITGLITMAVHWVNVGYKRHVYVGQTSAEQWQHIGFMLGIRDIFTLVKLYFSIGTTLVLCWGHVEHRTYYQADTNVLPI